MDLFGLCKTKKSRPHIKADAGSDLLKKRKGNPVGFTLVEALAVIAMIGCMAAIIIVRVSDAKKQGEDAAVKGALNEVRNAAELYYNKNYTYEDVCKKNDKTLSKDGDFGRLKDYIEKHYGEDGRIGCKASDDGFAVISSLSTGNCWCVDYQGVGKKIILGGPSEKCDDKLMAITCP